jgi:protein TonB
MRLGIFLAVGSLHVALLLLIAFDVEIIAGPAPSPLIVMKLTDLEELPPEPPKPQEERHTTSDPVAQNMVETDELPPEEPVAPRASQGEAYLPMHKVSVPPAFSEKEILQALVYPPIALRSGNEGMVVLELFISSAGRVQSIRIMKEEPPGKGFGEAALKAFQGRTCTPAQANGVPVAVRYRYPVRFTIK